MNRFVKEFYNANAAVEQVRLDLPLCRIEFVSTLRLIAKYFPEAGRVCDIGGGPGRYVIELLKRGYATTLVDLSDEAIRLAKTRLEELGLAAEQLLVGDAQDLTQLASESFDAALLLGPMYHLIEREARARALSELARILKPTGRAIIAYLNSWGLIKTGIVDFPNQYRDIAVLRAMLSERTFTGESLSNFTESYWSTPEVAMAEVERAGFNMISYAGAESFANGMGILLERLATENPEAYANVVEVAAATCELEQYRDSTDHLHIVVSK
jgi:S-adenosylmethionine-dependent methyltransferase